MDSVEKEVLGRHGKRNADALHPGGWRNTLCVRERSPKMIEGSRSAHAIEWLDGFDPLQCSV